MKIFTMLRQAGRAILVNKGRSFLTTLGIIIGIGSVIALISLGKGVQQSVNGRIATLGTTNITVLPGPSLTQARSGDRGIASGGPPAGAGSGFSRAASTLTNDDLTALRDTTRNPHLVAITADISQSAIFKVGDGEQRFSVIGTLPDYFSIRRLDITKGSLYTTSDIDSKSHVLVLGSKLAEEVYGSTDPIGRDIAIENDSYHIIGVLAQADESGFTNPNIQAYIPNSSAQATYNTSNFSSVTVKVDSEANVDQAKIDITKTLLGTHKINDEKLADFNVNTPKDLLSTVDAITGLLTSLLAGIAAISLLVGGIGIMNIMLVAVTERTREIGLRKAVGAKTADILGQFIIEAVLLTLIGGAMGIGLGMLLGRVAARVLGITPVPDAILLAVGVSSAVGLVFGIYPAAKAARLNPIDALRYE